MEKSAIAVGTGLAQCMDFGVRLAGSHVPAFADHLAGVDQHAADQWVGSSRPTAERCQRQRTLHRGAVGLAPVGW